MTAVLRGRPVLGAPTDWRFPKVEEQLLANGLRVLAVHLPGKRVATVSVLLDVPVDSDPRGHEGLASLAARCLSEGTAELGAEAFSDALQRQGASFRVTAGYEGSTATLDVPVSRLASALPLLAQAVMVPAFPEAEIERVRRQRLAEIVQERSGPPSRASLEFSAALYDASCRMAVPAAGTADSVGALDVDAVAVGYRGRVSAATSVVVVAGDLGGMDVGRLIDGAFGGWDSKAERFTPTSPVLATGPRAVVVDRPGSVQTQLLLGHAASGRTAPDWSMMAVAGYALGGTLTSRIDAVLREEKGYTYGMRAGFGPSRRTGAFTIAGSVDTASTAPALQDLMTVLSTALADGLRDEELVASRDYLVGVSPMRWETPAAVAQQILSVVGNDLPLGFTDSFLDGMRSATLDGLNTALRREVRPDELLVIAVGEADAVVGPLAERGFGDALVIDA